MPPMEEVYDEVAKYPAIPTFENEDEKEEAHLAERVKRMGTVEEKQYFLNMPKYFGWKCYMLKSSRLPTSFLAPLQYFTNTTLVDEGTFPAVYSDSDLDDKAGKLADSLQPFLKDILQFSLHGAQSKVDVPTDKIEYREVGGMVVNNDRDAAKVKHRAVVMAVNRLITSKLMGHEPHLKDSFVDENPRNEAFWFRGHLDPDFTVVQRKKGRLWSQGVKDPKPFKKAERQYDRPFQFMGDDTHVQIRCRKALRGFVPLEDPLVVSGEVPVCDAAPRHYFVEQKKGRFGTTLLGTWTGTDTPFSQLAIVDNTNMSNKRTTETAWHPDSEYCEWDDMVLEKALLNGFGIAYAQACQQGFSPFHDPLCPFVSQVCVTDGKKWKLSCYQLNKMAMVGISEPHDAMKRNVCWHLKEEELYHDKEGHVVDVNVDLFKSLIKFYLHQPTLGEEEVPNQDYLATKRHLYQIKNQFNREQFHANHRTMYANRPRSLNRGHGEILAHHRLWMMENPLVMQPFGSREQVWFKMANTHWKGREFWHPEFRWYDHHPGAYLPAKFRGPRRKHRTPSRLPVVSAPLPPDED